LQFPDTDPIELIDQTIITLKQNHISFTRFIQDYADFVIKISLEMNNKFSDETPEECTFDDHPVINGLIAMILKKKELI
jgi:hypothetical protein